MLSNKPARDIPGDDPNECPPDPPIELIEGEEWPELMWLSFVVLGAVVFLMFTLIFRLPSS